MESNDKRNSQLMDYRILSTIGSDCNSIIKYYGAIFADVKIFIFLFYIYNETNFSFIGFCLDFEWIDG